MTDETICASGITPTTHKKGYYHNSYLGNRHYVTQYVRLIDKILISLTLCVKIRLFI